MADKRQLPSSFSDRSANKNELILHAAEAIGRSSQKLNVFKAVYYHKKKKRTVPEVMEMTGLTRIQVLKAARALVNQNVMGQTTLKEEIAYEKDHFLQTNKEEIFRLVGDPNAQKAFPTKRNPTLKTPPSIPDTRFVTIESIENFKAAWREPPLDLEKPFSEAAFKKGLQNILGDEGRFKDWGGEKCDLFSVRLVLEGKRRIAAIALKGPGTQGRLKPKHMGKNADQIQRLFACAAEVFLVQYYDAIDESIIEQMKAFAEQKSRESNKPIYFGVIDGRDSRRLIAGYKAAFMT